MGFFSRLFGRKEQDTVGGMQDFMSLVRVYFQASIASQVGITNLAALPDLRTFKQTLHVQTVGNKLGVGEKSQCKKMLKEFYGIDDSFCKEIDSSVRKNCRKLQDVQVYMIQFQGFTQDLMMLLGNLMKLKLRMPSFFKSAIKQMTDKTVHEILTKNDYTDMEVMKTAVAIRKYNNKLGFTEPWISDFVFRIVMMAKKEGNKNEDNG